MAKINNIYVYPKEEHPTLRDFIIGTKDINGKTKNFPIQWIIQLINSVNGKNSIQFEFSDGTDPEINYLSEGNFFTNTNNTEVGSFTQLIFNKETIKPLDISPLFSRLEELEDVVIKLENPEDPNNFFNFKVISIEDHVDYFVFDVEDFNGLYLGEFINEGIYSFYFDIASVGSDDTKLDKGDYTGDAGILDDRIAALEGAQGKGNRFTGKSYVLWSGTGLTYDVIYTSYYLADVLYPGGVTQITLAASDPTNPRFDLVKVDATGVVVATGDASASPEVPTADPNTELAISPIFVEAGATTPPATVSNENVYQENAEWTPSTNNGTVNFNATSSPFQGSKHIDCGAFTNGQYLKFIDGAINQIADLSEIGIAINLKASFSNSTKFTVRFYNGTTLVSSIVTINSGSYNFDRNVINAYQLIIVPISSFTFMSSSFDRIDIVMAGANAVGFRMDNIILYKGSGSTSPEQNAITTIITDSGIVNATQKDDTFQFLGANGFLVSAVGKVITFTSNFTAALKSNYDTAYNWVSTNGANVVSHLSRTDNPHNVTKTQIGLGNVDNTSDVNKPVSTAQAAADATTLASANSYTDSKVSSLYKLKGSVANFASLPSSGNTVGDVWNLTDTGMNYVWTGSVWDALGTTVDISGKEDASNKTDDIETNKTSSTKYTSAKAVYDWGVAKFKTWVLGINPITGITYTIGINDNKTIGVFSNTNPVAFTVPTNASVAIPIGTTFEYSVQGAGTVTVGGAGITFVKKNLVFTTGDTFVLRKIGIDTWTVDGNLKVTTIIGNTFYVDTINGNDANGAVGDILRPFKTIDSALSGASTAGGVLNSVELVSEGTYYINNAYTAPSVTYEFISKKKVVISFETNANGTLFGNGSNGTNVFFNIPNGDIVFSSTVDQAFSRGIFKVVANLLTTQYASTGVLFSAATWVDINVRRIVLKKSLVSIFSSNPDYSVVRCEDLVVNNTDIKIVTASLYQNYRAFVYLLGRVTGTGNIVLASCGGEVHVNSINTTGNTSLGRTPINTTIKFYNSVISGTAIIAPSWGGGSLTLTGVIDPSSPGIGGGYLYNATFILDNFSHDFKNQSLYLDSTPKLVLKNVDLKCDTIPFTRLGGRTYAVDVYGKNSIYSRSQSVIFGNATSSPVTVNNYGEINSNITSLGTNVTNNIMNTITY